jgi:hypothetical protein
VIKFGQTLYVVHVWGPDGDIAFDLLMYGEDQRPSAERIRAAMRAVRLEPDDWVCSPFGVIRIR